MKKAFTLVEILMVISIVGILITIAVPAVSDSMQQARISETLAHARVLEAAKDSYKMAHPFAKGTITAVKLAPYYPQGYSSSDKLPCDTTKSFANTLDLDNPVTFTYNGKTYSSIEAQPSNSGRDVIS